MATGGVLLAIAGLQRPPTSRDLELSRAVLPHPEEQPEISDATLKALGEIFVRNGVQDVFGIHLLHSYFIAPEGTVLLGIEAQLSEKSRACWTKPVPYELQEGEVDDKALGARPDFFQEFASFLHRNNLADLVALQLLDGSQDSTRMELLVGPQATLMVDEKALIGFEPPRITTGWSFQVGDDGIISCKGNDVYAEKKNTHQVFTDSKPLPTIEALKEALCGEGLIA